MTENIMHKKTIDWHFLSTILSIVISVAGSYYMIHRDLKSDMMIRDQQHKEDMKMMKLDMGKMDEKWERLFTLFVQDRIDSREKK